MSVNKKDEATSKKAVRGGPRFTFFTDVFLGLCIVTYNLIPQAAGFARFWDSCLLPQLPSSQPDVKLAMGLMQRGG